MLISLSHLSLYLKQNKKRQQTYLSFDTFPRPYSYIVLCKGYDGYFSLMANTVNKRLYIILEISMSDVF